MEIGPVGIVPISPLSYILRPPPLPPLTILQSNTGSICVTFNWEYYQVLSRRSPHAGHLRPPPHHPAVRQANGNTGTEDSHEMISYRVAQKIRKVPW